LSAPTAYTAWSSKATPARRSIPPSRGRELGDDWFELTREVLDATGIEPDDDPAACWWAALRNQAHGLDIVATVIRQDGRWAHLHNDAYFARSACANFTYDHGLDEPG
jgi:hypothetical protein